MQNTNTKLLWLVIIYLFLLLGFYVYSIICILVSQYLASYCPNSLIRELIVNHSLILQCVFFGGIGGVIYCFRSVYINYCIYKRWDCDYIVWYLIRPIISLVIGGISYTFIKAGLVLFSSSQQYEINQLSILSLAFLSGLNVDKFMKKLESIGELVWGISPSNLSKENEKGN